MITNYREQHKQDKRKKENPGKEWSKKQKRAIEDPEYKEQQLAQARVNKARYDAKQKEEISKKGNLFFY
jgi:hypothetical protein